MRKDALFLNGGYEDVLEQILVIQRVLPEQIMFLQPYSGERIVNLAENPPSVDDPMRVFVSTTDDLDTVHFTGEIVGWDDKRTLPDDRRNAISRLIWTLQPDESGLYGEIKPGKPCVNLLYIRRLKKFNTPFSVKTLRRADSGEPVAGGRTTSGGWIYVKPEPADS